MYSMFNDFIHMKSATCMPLISCVIFLQNLEGGNFSWGVEIPVPPPFLVMSSDSTADSSDILSNESSIITGQSGIMEELMGALTPSGHQRMIH